MDINAYIIIWTNGTVLETSVFSSKDRAKAAFDKLVIKFGLTERESYKCYYLREAYGFGNAKTESREGKLVLARKQVNYCTI